jgi:hypothetical protein
MLIAGTVPVGAVNCPDELKLIVPLTRVVVASVDPVADPGNVTL